MPSLENTILKVKTIKHNSKQKCASSCEQYFVVIRQTVQQMFIMIPNIKIKA